MLSKPLDTTVMLQQESQGVSSLDVIGPFHPRSRAHAALSGTYVDFRKCPQCSPSSSKENLINDWTNNQIFTPDEFLLGSTI
jgi:hypothetical protein